jgi:hypothetical protein
MNKDQPIVHSGRKIAALSYEKPALNRRNAGFIRPNRILLDSRKYSHIFKKQACPETGHACAQKGIPCARIAASVTHSQYEATHASTDQHPGGGG